MPALSWDDDEVETQIYDKAPDEEVVSSVQIIETVNNIATVDHKPPADKPLLLVPSNPQIPPVTLPLPLTRPATAELMPLPTRIPPEQPSSGRSNLLLWISLPILVLLVCGGLLFYFFVHLPRKPGHLLIKTIPADVIVKIDGKPQPQPPGGTPLTLRDLLPGHYIVSVEKAGYEPWTQTIQIKPGRILPLTPQLEVAATASIELRTKPSGADAFLDGRKLERRTPMKIDLITPGKHTLEVRKPDYQPWLHHFQINPEQVLRLTTQLLPLALPVKILSDPPKAEVFLERDGKRHREGITPMTVNVNPKYQWSLILRRQGYRDWRQPIVFEGEGRPLTIKGVLPRQTAPSVSEPSLTSPKVRARASRATPLNPPPSEPAAAEDSSSTTPASAQTGILAIGSRPWTQIFIDGKDTGLVTPRRISLAPGVHKVTLQNPKFNIDVTFPVTIKANEETKVIKKLLENP
jgi:hypothetical protein